MEQKEVETAVGELEERVDRLRALYEQYFLGFEKLEPTVPRKDVDRRFAILRKENIRNTALRFRFNVVTQKYNTYAMHWTRICRQIEEGTFKRHVKKAQERFGDVAKRRDREEASFDIDIDMDDLDDVDVDALLAEADRAAATIDRGANDTVPPAAASVPPPSAPVSEPRLARPAALPAGGPKPRLVRKVVKADSGGPAPSEPPTVMAQAPISSPRVPGAPVSSPRPIAPAAASAPQIRPRAPSAADGSIRGPLPAPPPSAPGARPVTPQIRPRMPSSAGPESSQRLAAAPPPQSERRLPMPPPSAPGLPTGRTPVAPAGGGARPMIRPRPPSASQPDLGTAEPASRPAAAPVPPSAQSKPRLPLPSQISRDEKD